VQIIRNICDADIDAIVKLHQRAFPEFFLTRLGGRFLKILYRAFLNDRKCIFILAEVDGSICGFAVGSLPGAKSYRRIAFENAIPIFFSSFGRIVKSRMAILERICFVLFAKSVSRIQFKSIASLRSIAVDPMQHGTGIAVKMLLEFEKVALAQGASSVLLTTDADQNERVIRFYNKCGYKVCRRFKSGASRTMLELFKKI
jgi:ribosomal protein S18 acetylase RimI-like enzyme